MPAIGTTAHSSGAAMVRRIMTADVAQAVAGLKRALLDADHVDQEVSEAQTEGRKIAATLRKQSAKRVLTKRRAELEALLLGDEAES